MSIDQSNSCRKEFSWLHFDDEPREGDQWRKDQQSYRPVSVAHLSGIVNWGYKDNFKPVYFTKRFHAHENTHKQTLTKKAKLSKN